MSKSRYGSQNQVIEEQLIDFQRNELQVLSQNYIDTLSPAITSMEAVQIVLEMTIELGDYVKKNGKSDRGEKSAKRLNRLLQLIIKLNTVTGDLNTLQLSNRSLLWQIEKVRIENASLKKELNKITESDKF